MKLKEYLESTLGQLEKQKGMILPKDLVDIARHEDSPIHEMFEWDDSKAAQEYRLQQARQMIREVRVEIEGKTTQAYYNVKVQEREPSQGYVSVTRILADEQMSQSLIKDALREIDHWQKRYETLEQLKGLIDETKLAKLKREN